MPMDRWRIVGTFVKISFSRPSIESRASVTYATHLAIVRRDARRMRKVSFTSPYISPFNPSSPFNNRNGNRWRDHVMKALYPSMKYTRAPRASQRESKYRATPFPPPTPLSLSPGIRSWLINKALHDARNYERGLRGSDESTVNPVTRPGTRSNSPVFMKFKTGDYTNGDIFYEDARALSEYFYARSTVSFLVAILSFARLIWAACCTDIAVRILIHDSFVKIHICFKNILLS